MGLTTGFENFLQDRFGDWGRKKITNRRAGTDSF
jgi:hypothetical protein